MFRYPGSVAVGTRYRKNAENHGKWFRPGQGTSVRWDSSLSSPSACLTEVNGYCVRGIRLAVLLSHLAHEPGKPVIKYLTFGILKKVMWTFWSAVTGSLVPLSNPVMKHSQGPCVTLHGIFRNTTFGEDGYILIGGWRIKFSPRTSFQQLCRGLKVNQIGINIRRHSPNRSLHTATWH